MNQDYTFDFFPLGPVCLCVYALWVLMGIRSRWAEHTLLELTRCHLSSAFGTAPSPELGVCERQFL